MKYLKIGITIVMVVVIAAAIIQNKIYLDKYVKKYQVQKEKNSRTLHAMSEIKKAVISGQTASMKHQGKHLKLTGLEKIFPKEKNEENMIKKPRLILVFSELSCNVCQDKETQFAINIASEYNTQYVTAIVHATNIEYVQNYIRLNQVNFPVYYCKDRENSFFKDNKILNTPMIFLVDENNRVLAANYPIPGHLEYSEPMHRFCYHYFNEYVNCEK